MAEGKYDKLERMRADIEKDKERDLRLQEQIRQKEAKLKEAEAVRIVADVAELDLTPEQLGEYLELIKTGEIDRLLRDATKYRPSVKPAEAVDEEEEEEDEDNGNEED